MKKLICAIHFLLSLKSFGIFQGKSQGIEGVPWQVSIQYDELQKHFCGGALISDQYILSAAHCLDDHWPQDLESIGVYAGSSDLSQITKLPVIEEIILHSRFNKETFENDIALIKLQEPITFSKTMMPISLDDAFLASNHSSEYGLKAIISGWGAGDHQNSNILQSGEVIVSECSGVLCDNYKENKEVFLSAHSAKCGKGDSGGVAVAYSEFHQSYKAIGIGSYTKLSSVDRGCVYTKVSVYRDWVKALVQGRRDPLIESFVVKSEGMFLNGVKYNP